MIQPDFLGAFDYRYFAANVCLSLLACGGIVWLAGGRSFSGRPSPWKLTLASLGLGGIYWLIYTTGCLSAGIPLSLEQDMRYLSLLLALSALLGCWVVLSAQGMRRGSSRPLVDGALIITSCLLFEYGGYRFIEPDYLHWKFALTLPSLIMGAGISLGIAYMLNNNRKQPGQGSSRFPLTAALALRSLAMACLPVAAKLGNEALLLVYKQTYVYAAPLAYLLLFSTLWMALLAYFQRHSAADRRQPLSRGSERRDSRYFEPLYTANPDAVFRLDLLLRFAHVNAAMTRFSGYEANELAGMSALHLLNPREASNVLHHFYQALKGQASSFECLLLQKNGSFRSVLMTTIPIQAEKAVGIYVIAKDVNDQRHDYEQLQYLVEHDEQTHLRNQRSFLKAATGQIQQTLESGLQFSLLLVNLDRFQALNELYGFEFANRIMKEAARRLRLSVPPGSILARLGGDEFTIILPAGPSTEHGGQLASHLVAQFARPLFVGSKALLVSVSIGVASYPDHGSDAWTLILHAHKAMSEAKSAGANQYSLFDPGSSLGPEDSRLEADLAAAFEHNQLRLLYQARLDASTSRLIGIEALLRWEHPQLGLLKPDRFLPMAEATGHAVRLDAWSLKQACLQNKKWQELGCTPVPVTVNVSRRHLLQADFIEHVNDALLHSGLAPGYLAVEINESVILDGGARALDKLAELRKLGVQISMDHFGASFISLHNLQAYPVDRLNISRELIQGIQMPEQQDAIVLLATIAKHLRLTVAAVGVETTEQEALLRELGVELMQGFHFGKPLDEEEFGKRLPSAAPSR